MHLHTQRLAEALQLLFTCFLHISTLLLSQHTF